MSSWPVKYMDLQMIPKRQFCMSNVLGYTRVYLYLETKGKMWWRHRQTDWPEMKKTHHPRYWTLSILGADLFLSHAHTSCLICRDVHLKNVPVKQKVLAWLSCNPLIHHTRQFLIPHPFMPGDHHSRDIVPALNWTYVCVWYTIHVFVSQMNR